MRTYLRKEEFVPYASDVVGKEVRAYHCTTGKGKDKLFIKRCEDGSIVAHCKHCGATGFYKAGKRVRHYTELKRPVKTPVKVSKDVYFPLDGLSDIHDWPKEARVYLLKYGISLKEIENYGITYSPSRGRLIFPIITRGEKTGYAARRVLERDERPKWLLFDSSDNHYILCPFHLLYSDTAIIVEDYISGIKCSRFADTYVVLGTSVSRQLYHELKSSYKRFYIFLDNDNPKVKVTQKKIRVELEPYGEVTIIRSDKDPKEHNMSELSSLLGEFK